MNVNTIIASTSGRLTTDEARGRGDDLWDFKDFRGHKRTAQGVFRRNLELEFGRFPELHDLLVRIDNLMLVEFQALQTQWIIAAAS